MSMHDSGPSPERRGPAPRKPVRPSIRPFTRTLMDKPFQPFEQQILQRMVASEQDFRIFCMFGRPVGPSLPGCERPVTIRGRVYDSRILRTLYIGAATERILAGADAVPSPQADTDGRERPADPAETLHSRTVVQRMLQPLLRDATLLEVAGHAKPTFCFAHLGTVLATLCFENFSTAADPLATVHDIADGLAKEGLLHAPSDIIDLDGVAMFSLGFKGTPRGRAHLAEHVLPRWECARVRRSRSLG